MLKKAKLFSGTRASRITGAGIAVALIFLMLSVIATVSYWDCLSANETTGSTLRNVAVIIAGLVALPLAIARILVVGDQADTADRSLANDRYQRGAEMLGHKEQVVRVGGINALTEIARQYPGQYLHAALRLLCTFMRTQCAGPITPDFEGRLDLQSAVKAISSFGPEQRGTIGEGNYPESLNLGGVKLRGVRIWDINFAGMDLRAARFEDCNLGGADLSGANLAGATFADVNMADAVLDGALISDVHFESDILNLTQGQLDKATAAKEAPPRLEGNHDAETGEPLVWNRS